MKGINMICHISVFLLSYGCCELSENEITDGIETDVVEVNAGIDFGNGMTRTFVDKIDEDNNLTLKWESEDDFSVAGCMTDGNVGFISKSTLESDISEDERSISFKAMIPKNSSELVFFYPMENSSCFDPEKNTLVRTLPSVQSTDEFNRCNLMRTDMVETTSLKNSVISFMQQTCVVVYRFKYPKDEAATIKSICLKCKDIDGKTTLYTQVTTSLNDSASDEYSEAALSGITLKCEGALQEEYYMNIFPPDEGRTSTLEVSLGFSDGSYKSVSVEAGESFRNIKAGDYYVLNIDLNDAEDSDLPTDTDDDVLLTYSWPVNDGQAKLSEHYQVFVSVEDSEEIELQVLQSDPIVNNIRTDGTSGEDHLAKYTKQRSFSFVTISYDPSKGKELNFRIVSKDGYSSTGAIISPKSYGIVSSTSGNEIQFSINQTNRYIGVNYDVDANVVKIPKGQGGSAEIYNWVRHMLCIFIDPMETSTPDPSTEKIVYYTSETTASELRNADVIYFRPGYYNLKTDGVRSDIINEYGGLKMFTGQKVYIEGGAFVEGYILRNDYNDKNQYLYGRGILSGRQYTWQPGDNERIIKQIVQLGHNSVIDGLTVIESPHHGMVPAGNATINNVKFLGWHCNNDGFRPGWGSKVSNCFIRACDDFFYNYQLNISDCVLWPAWNGSILTNGWNKIDIGGTKMNNIDVIFPEWLSMGNNRGLIMSQNDYAFDSVKEKGRTEIKNVRFEGKIPGFVNLKPNSGYKDGRALLTSSDDLGWMGYILLENISVENHEDKNNNLIKGGCPAVAGDPNSTWWIDDVILRNITIGGIPLTDANKSKWFNIDESTTKNIKFE